MKKKPKFFLYRERPFRPLYHEHYFQEPRRIREALRGAAHIWWFTDRDLARRLCSDFNRTETTQMAEDRDYVRISGGGSPYPSNQPPRQSKPPKSNSTIDDL